MELIERAGLLDTLQEKFSAIQEGEGHCILVTGEAGMGKTSLIRAFCKEKKNECTIYQGTCDALFTPRPLAPLYDIVLQMGSDLLQQGINHPDKTQLFASFFQEFANHPETSVIVFEDIHWADEATLDFIKFLARRISRIPCLFILTYRHDEIHNDHPLRHVLGQLPPDTFTRLQLNPLSKDAVKKMATEQGKGDRGEDVYAISNGIPFYVNEILASYSQGIPDNIKDSILSVYNRQAEKLKRVWEVLSVLPTGFEMKYLEQLEASYPATVANCLQKGILVLKEDMIFFKHELYRRTIEAALSPLIRIDLHKKILELFLENFEQNHETERIIHHAKNANEYDLVERYAPVAAKQAAAMGAHLESSKLYYTAIEYYQGTDKNKLIPLYEGYSYECYLTNRIKEAIIYQGKLLTIWKEKNDREKIGNCLRFLSRLWWYDGHRKQAQEYAIQAIDALKDEPASAAKAMAFSNMSQLKMLSDERDECISWGEKAIALAKELKDEEILSHAYNNVGSVHLRNRAEKQKGTELLELSLAIALKNGYHEHAARAYTNLGSSLLEVKEYTAADKALTDGILYCEERDLDSWTTYMSSCKAWMYLETKYWDEAFQLAEILFKNEELPAIVRMGALAVLAKIKMRKGEADALPLLLEGKEKAFEAMELQRIIPFMVALLEYEWITGNSLIGQAEIDTTTTMIGQMGNVYQHNEFAFWLYKVRKQKIKLKETVEEYTADTAAKARKAAALWEAMNCPYEQAMLLFEGNENDKKEAISLVHTLGATAVYEKMKQEMRNAGIKSIPRGVRKSTSSNPAQLTERELDVLQLLKEGLQNKEIASRLYISAKTVDHHISAILFKLDVNSRVKAVQEAIHLEIIK